MRKFPWFESVLIVGLAIALIVKPQNKQFSAAAEPARVASRQLVGQVISLGKGQARSWVRTNERGEPTSVGFTLTEAALQGLPKTDGAGCCGNEYVLRLPTEVAVAPFTHLVLNWNSKGHPPEGVYDKPHFDFHFYMQSPESREAIPSDSPDMHKFPAADRLPEGYVETHEGVAKMGMHWIDPTSDEFVGKGFSKTFIYGTYAGRVTFLEPMITKAYLESKPSFVQAIKLPKVLPAGYFPTSYSIKYDPTTKEYTVALEGLTRN